MTIETMKNNDSQNQETSGLRFSSVDEYTNKINELMKELGNINDISTQEQIEIKLSNLRTERGQLIRLKERAEEAANQKIAEANKIISEVPQDSYDWGGDNRPSATK